MGLKITFKKPHDLFKDPQHDDMYRKEITNPQTSYSKILNEMLKTPFPKNLVIDDFGRQHQAFHSLGFELPNGEWISSFNFFTNLAGKTPQL